ncbi:MAG: hypothetical protein EA403_06840 [Spirochaetaceae bacterium]|nr:MAG: hypothetical protein EA403_06840 [Spirochaetaceae bacterium]
MSIQPIDMQTLFLRLNQIGHEQSAERNALQQGQSVVGSEIARQSELKKSVVDESHDVEDGPEQLHEDGSDNSNKRSSDQAPRDSSEEAQPEVLRDPDLGRNIDITR